MKSPVLVCPVPSEQQPLNEYEALKASWFFGWAGKDLKGYARPIVIIWGLCSLVTGPIAATSFAPAHAPVQFALSTAAGALILPIILMLQLFSSWSYVRNRLMSATVSYEESGWYDGQSWAKPEEVLNRDRLIVSYQIAPILNRLKWTFGGLIGGVILAGAAVFYL